MLIVVGLWTAERERLGEKACVLPAEAYIVVSVSGLR
jgi:hypothetical protein